MMKYSNVEKEVEMELLNYNNTRTKLADRLREHDLLELETKLNIEKLKKDYEEKGYKSTQAKYMAERDEELNLKELIELEHEIQTLKGRKDYIEYRFTYLCRRLDYFDEVDDE